MCIIQNSMSYITIAGGSSNNIGNGGQIATTAVEFTIQMHVYVTNNTPAEDSFYVAFYDNNRGYMSEMSDYIYANTGDEGYIQLPGLYVSGWRSQRTIHMC